MERFSHSKSINRSKVYCDPSTIGGRITYYRLENNLTQQELANKSGLDRNTIVDYERNNLEHKLGNINIIADTLNIDPFILYDDYLAFIAIDYGNQIKKIRKEMNLTQKQFCKLAGFRDTVGHWERYMSPPSRISYNVLKKYL